MMGENQILAAAVDVDGFSQIPAGHGGAFDMPARPPVAPGGGPAGLSRLGRLPQGEIHGILLFLPDGNARSRFQIVQRLMGQLAVFVKFVSAEIHVPIGRPVRIALFHQSGDEALDLLHVFRGLGMHGGLPHAQPLGVHPELLDIPGGDLLIADPFLIGPADDLVVDVGEVLDEFHLVAPPFQVPAQHVEHAQGPRVADMDVVVHRGAARVNARHSRLQRHQLFLLAGQGVVNLHGLRLSFQTEFRSGPPGPPSSVSLFRRAAACGGHSRIVIERTPSGPGRLPRPFRPAALPAGRSGAPGGTAPGPPGREYAPGRDRRF